MSINELCNHLEFPNKIQEYDTNGKNLHSLQATFLAPSSRLWPFFDEIAFVVLGWRRLAPLFGVASSASIDLDVVAVDDEPSIMSSRDFFTDGPWSEAIVEALRLLPLLLRAASLFSGFIILAPSLLGSVLLAGWSWVGLTFTAFLLTASLFLVLLLDDGWSLVGLPLPDLILSALYPQGELLLTGWSLSGLPTVAADFLLLALFPAETFVIGSFVAGSSCTDLTVTVLFLVLICFLGKVVFFDRVFAILEALISWNTQMFGAKGMVEWVGGCSPFSKSPLCQKNL